MHQPILRKEINGIIITIHAQERALQRNLVKSLDELYILADKCISEGLDVFADPTLRKLVEDRIPRFERSGTSGMYAINGIVFIFNDNRIVTVIPISWLALFDDRELLAA